MVQPQLTRWAVSEGWRRGWDSSAFAKLRRDLIPAAEQSRRSSRAIEASGGGLAERVGFEPTCRLPDKTLSRRPRYDHFGTSPVVCSGSWANVANTWNDPHARGTGPQTEHYTVARRTNPRFTGQGNGLSGEPGVARSGSDRHTLPGMPGGTRNFTRRVGHAFERGCSQPAADQPPACACRRNDPSTSCGLDSTWECEAQILAQHAGIPWVPEMGRAVTTEQPELTATAQVVPQLLELVCRPVVAVCGEHIHHLTVNPQRRATGRQLANQRCPPSPRTGPDPAGPGA